MERFWEVVWDGRGDPLPEGSRNKLLQKLVFWILGTLARRVLPIAVSMVRFSFAFAFRRAVGFVFSDEELGGIELILESL